MLKKSWYIIKTNSKHVQPRKNDPFIVGNLVIKIFDRAHVGHVSFVGRSRILQLHVKPPLGYLFNDCIKATLLFRHSLGSRCTFKPFPKP